MEKTNVSVEMWFVVTQRNPRGVFPDDLLLAQVFSNFIRCETWFSICRFLAEAALLCCVYLTSEGERNFVRDGIRSVALCFNFTPLASCKGKAREGKWWWNARKGNCKWIIRSPQEAAQIHQGRCLEEVWLALPFSSGRLYFRNSRRGRRKARAYARAINEGLK